MSDAPPTLIHADPRQRVVVDSNTLPWVPSPEPGVDRRMLEREGGEVARATSIVRYAAGSRFARHVHALGEEFLVLDGVFSDEHGDFPVGSYVRNPPGSGHAPFTRDGCTIFVKLRQMQPEGEPPVQIDTRTAAWQPGATTGTWRMPLFEPADGRERVVLETLDPGAALPEDVAAGGEEILVLAGSLADGAEIYGPGTWLRLPPGTRRRWTTQGGCTFWVKRDHLARLT